MTQNQTIDICFATENESVLHFQFVLFSAKHLKKINSYAGKSNMNYKGNK